MRPNKLAGLAFDLDEESSSDHGNMLSCSAVTFEACQQELSVVALPSGRWCKCPGTAGHGVDKAEIDYAVETIKLNVAKLRDLSPLWDMYKEGIDISTIQWAAH